MTNVPDRPLIENMKMAIREVMEEEKRDKSIGNDVAIFNLPCKFCNLPIKAGQTFLLYHGDCYDQEQALR